VTYLAATKQFVGFSWKSVQKFFTKFFQQVLISGKYQLSDRPSFLQGVNERNFLSELSKIATRERFAFRKIR
jgi:hypothetical protein